MSDIYLHILWSPAPPPGPKQQAFHNHQVRHGSRCNCCCCLGMCEDGSAKRRCTVACGAALWPLVTYKGKTKKFKWQCPKCHRVRGLFGVYRPKKKLRGKRRKAARTPSTE